MNEIKECYDLFKKYCKQELIYFATIQFFDDESGDIMLEDTKRLFSFDSFQECINLLKEKIN